MRSARSLAITSLFVALAGLVLGGVCFLGSSQLGTYGYQVYCEPNPGTECTIPSWVETAGSALFGLSMLLPDVAFLVALVLGIVAWRRARADASGTGLPIASTLLAALLLLPAWGYSAIIALFITSGGGPHGRPLRILGVAVPSRARRRAWGAPLAPELEGLDATTRQALADAWVEDARLEHSAIAAFGRLAADLLAVGAPPDLIESAHRAAADEVRHAHACFALASAYGGVAVGPDDLGAARAPALPRTRRGLLETLLRESILDGMIGEGAAATTASAARDTASDPVVRDLLDVIAREESEHAALAEEIVRWVRAELESASAESIVDAALTEATHGATSEGSADALVRHGRPSRTTCRRARETAIERTRAALGRVATAAAA